MKLKIMLFLIRSQWCELDLLIVKNGQKLGLNSNIPPHRNLRLPCVWHKRFKIRFFNCCYPQRRHL